MQITLVLINGNRPSEPKVLEVEFIPMKEDLIE